MAHVLVVDDHPAVREGTKAILEGGDGIKVSCLNPPFTIEAVKQTDFSSYDAILMDMNLGDINGIEISKAILEVNESSKIILYTGYDVMDYMEEALSLGIYGAINKTESKEKLLSYIYHAIGGNVVIPYSFFKELLFQKKTNMNTESSNKLNEREKAILQEVEKGFTNQEIADHLHLSKRSIEYSLTSIFSKLNCGSRTEAILISRAEGVLEDGN